jgi:hypothetical protein
MLSTSSISSLQDKPRLWQKSAVFQEITPRAEARVPALGKTKKFNHGFTRIYTDEDSRIRLKFSHTPMDSKGK